MKSQTTSVKDIKKADRKLAAKNHPDKNPKDKDEE
ncbi:MAG: DnaJ domain-containing protein [Oceanihabitans sp.]|nr:DnaJ domain-containing protein [Oceanihabitans sp.]